MHRVKNKGVTLVELIMAFAIIVIIFAAVVPQFRAIRNSWAGTEARGEIMQNGRVLAEHINRNLAAAARIIAVSADGETAGSITFEDIFSNQKCYKLIDNYIVFGNLGSEEQLAGLVDRFQISCYSLSDFENPTTDANAIRFIRIETDFPNSDTSVDKAFISEVFIQANQQSGQNVIDIMVKADQPNSIFDYQAGDYGCNAVIQVEGVSSNVHGLLCFNDIIGEASGQIPAGQEITEAKLKLWYVNENFCWGQWCFPVYLYRMLVPWTESSTWNSIGGGLNDGVNCDMIRDIRDEFDVAVPATVQIDVTDIVQSWIDGSDNYGFGINLFQFLIPNNIQFAASENTTGSGAHTPILEIRNSLPLQVQIIGSWVSGASHAKESGTDRALLFIAHAEDNSSSRTLDSVTYGGRAMTKIVEIGSNGSSTKTYTAAFILDEPNIAAASGNTFVPDWSHTPDRYVYESVFLQNVNQTALTGATAANQTSSGSAITTSALVTSDGDMVIDAATCGNSGSYTVNNGFTEAFEYSGSNFDAVAGFEFATGANETPSVTHSTSNGRQTIIGFVVQAALQEDEWIFSGQTTTILP